ncbi:hypothetical protein [Streptosporangium subroseum]|uniref:hypothetical protein n=1 Tax=Streptosporangium subroseum TaxID=106412 RepID=UPI00308C04F6|nr:hypothetical protein OHB15_45560 [Streptosporangium subroseum]
MANYKTLLTGHLLAPFGKRVLPEITPEMVGPWERSVVAAGYSPRTAKDARGVLITILGDAVRAGYIPNNPAARIRGKGPRGYTASRHSSGQRRRGRRRSRPC